MKKLVIIFLFIPSFILAQPNILKMEYWIGADPGFGLANQITGFSIQPNISFIDTISSNLVKGFNVLGFRSMDTNNVWSHTNFLTFYVIDSSSKQISETEFFWDVDSGFNTSSDTIYSNPDSIFNSILAIKIPMNLALGPHILFIRSKDTRRSWSHTNYIDSISVTGTVNITEFNEQSGVTIYPNPFLNNLTIAPKENRKTRFVVYNETGQLVVDKTICELSQLNTENLARGSYTIFVWSEEKEFLKQ